MGKFSKGLTLAAAASALFAATALPASAACTRLGFSVNDYGKEGPTRDAKELLDKYIAKWAGEHSIAKYTTGKKDVTCELFLNFIVFDEHTCKAEATVCWDGTPLPKSEISAEGGAAESKPAAAKQTTGSIEKPAAKPAEKAAKKVEPAAKPESHAAAVTKEAAPAAPAAAAPAAAEPAKSEDKALETPVEAPKLVKPAEPDAAPAPAANP
jgi:hypothetical protein